MCDLPDIKNGWTREEMSYGSEPLTHFQRKVILLDKIKKTIDCLNFIFLKITV
jgi:hypothetical protein